MSRHGWWLGMLLWLSLPAVAVERLTVRVLETLPHDINAFTQGLEWHDGRLFESTGLYGQSSLRWLEGDSGEPGRRIMLADSLFGEGLARVEDRLVQLTWREGLALVWQLPELRLLKAFSYQGEGWGLCFDGDSLWMSDGSATLQRRDPADFTLQRRLNVRLGGVPQGRLNDLACVGRHIYANVWKQARILRIRKDSGEVDAVIDASALLPLSQRVSHHEAVLNGIAHDQRSGDFYLTGKWWPRLFRVRFVQAPGAPDAGNSATPALSAR
ncbi:glutaminyl-peptide cyclotransferase [Oceanimonas doudoroffii]|uniref:Glutaminyl-peptide cyclotransferase n=1 Tax=Oceanimonas doudoroffii TaxID=84158 RepID=A0A233RCW2_9GAMM|nr:glutaminyl-peptide cyclotransferase [Oceanimonas doudoroffii]OXY81212.1 glutaminyl-peptide cyclotransferase [Oceanimonas doudoroffii]